MVKKGLIFFSLICFSLSFSQIKWMSLEKAMELQKVNPKKIFIEFYTDHCANCKKMAKTTFLNPTIYNYINKHYYAVRLNAKSRKNLKYKSQIFGYNKEQRLHDFALYMNVNLSPSMVFLDEKANPITILQGSLTAREFDSYLHFFTTNKYLKIKTKKDWENYLLKFKSKIKD